MAALWRTARPHLIMLGVVVAWEWTGVSASRYYAGQSIMALPFSALLTLFWLIGIKLGQDRRLWPTAIGGAIIGTWLGITWP